MSDFDMLCKQLEEMDPETFVQIFNQKSVNVISALADLTADGKDGVTAYMQSILASVAADGKLSEEEYVLLKPMFDRAAKKDTTYEEGKQLFQEMGLDDPAAYKDIVDTMVDIIGLVDEDLKDDIVLLCLLVCAIDGEVSDEEKDWIRQLVEPLTSRSVSTADCSSQWAPSRTSTSSSGPTPSARSSHPPGWTSSAGTERPCSSRTPGSCPSWPT